MIGLAQVVGTILAFLIPNEESNFLPENEDGGVNQAEAGSNGQVNGAGGGSGVGPITAYQQQNSGHVTKASSPSFKSGHPGFGSSAYGSTAYSVDSKFLSQFQTSGKSCCSAAAGGISTYGYGHGCAFAASRPETYTCDCPICAKMPNPCKPNAGSSCIPATTDSTEATVKRSEFEVRHTKSHSKK